jgi:hypothetical protein
MATTIFRTMGWHVRRLSPNSMGFTAQEEADLQQEIHRSGVHFG